jgi:putative addiction module killer protein
MIAIRESFVFERYLRGLKDMSARSRIVTRIGRLAMGNPGDVRSVGEGISELRIDYGPGYRVYYKQKGDVLILVLCDGDKRSQDDDIIQAKQLAKEMESQ